MYHFITHYNIIYTYSLYETFFLRLVSRLYVFMKSMVLNCMFFCVQVSLFGLEEALEGRTRQIPYEAILALDVVMRHLPSMSYTPVGRSFFSSPDGYYHPLGTLLSLTRLSYFVLYNSYKLKRRRYCPLKYLFRITQKWWLLLNLLLTGGGREVWFGFHQSVRPSQWKMMLNIDGNLLHFTVKHSCLHCVIFYSVRDGILQGSTSNRIYVRSTRHTRYQWTAQTTNRQPTCQVYQGN